MTNGLVPDLEMGSDELKRFPLGPQFPFTYRWFVAYRMTFAARWRRSIIGENLLEEIRSRVRKNLGRFIEFAGAEPVGSALVFLYLPKSDAQRLAQRALCQTEKGAPLPTSLAYVNVNKVKPGSNLLNA